MYNIIVNSGTHVLMCDITQSLQETVTYFSISDMNINTFI